MDELAGLLESSFQVSNDQYSTSAVHPRYSQYKLKTATSSDQEIRRRRILQQQKQARHDYQDHVRQLTGRGALASDKPQSKYLYRGGRGYRDQLMLSEWMVEVPEDLEDNYVIVPCPVGKRCLVIASDGQTTSWSKGGWLINKFPSLLPGGNRRDVHFDRDSTVLDCLYSELTQTYYVLDMMCWKQQPQYECETEFRFYWMATKFEEIPGLKQITKLNKFRFDVLPNYRCERQNIGNLLQTKMNVQLDGLLFYHKHTHYIPGSTPLVTWLKPYMIPDILGVAVSDEHMRYKPVTYTSFEGHLQKVKDDQLKAEEKERARKERRRQQRTAAGSQGMDTSAPTTEASANSGKPATSADVIESDVIDNQQTTDVTEADLVDDQQTADVIIEEEVLIDEQTTVVEPETDITSFPGALTSECSSVDSKSALQWSPVGNQNPYKAAATSQMDTVVQAEFSNHSNSAADPQASAAAEISLQAGVTDAAPISVQARKEKKPVKKLRAQKTKGRNA